MDWINNGIYGSHYSAMAIVAIDAIVDLGYRYGCLKKRLDIRIAASEADFVKIMNLRGKN